MPKATKKTYEEEGEEVDVPLHSEINEEGVCLHTQNLDKIMDDLASKIESGEPDAMKQAINSFKEAISAIILGMEEANPVAVLRAVKDPSSLAICPCTEEREHMLEEMVPREEIPMVSDVIQNIKESDILTEGDKALLGELFDSLEVAHKQLAMACSLLGRLS